MARIYTVGHGNLDEHELFANLARHGVEVVVDVRSTPYSGRNPQFNQRVLQAHTESRGLTYRWEYWLGGKPKEPSLWLAEGIPDYPRMAQHPECQEALDRLAALAAQSIVVLLCSETDPAGCHRVRMLTAPLLERGLEPRHILRDGSVRDEVGATGMLL